MIDRHMRDLRLDRRLQRRRGWISAQEMQEVTDGLPDVAAKGELVTDEDDEDAPAAGAPTESL